MSPSRTGLPPALVDDVDDVLRRVDALLDELHCTLPSGVARPTDRSLLARADHLLPAHDPDAGPADPANVLIQVYADLTGVLDTLRHEIHRLTADPARSRHDT